jgi:hypothetical protein
MIMPGDTPEREAERQQLLLHTLLREAPAEPLQAWMREPETRAARALEAYRANAGASAERALAAGFPVLQAMLGDEAFAQLARAYWHAHPPARGDLAWLGESLPAFIAADAQFAQEPYLADCARLEWTLSRAEAAADALAEPQSLALLADTDPAQVRLELMPGSAALVSAHPIVTIWQAHQGAPDGDRFAAVRAAFASGAGECAWVWREGWRARAAPTDDATCAFLRALLEGRDLAAALHAAGADFDFESWLVLALRRGCVRRACVAAAPQRPPP